MKQIVIIGAGPAGLSAAYEILKNSNEYKVIILEKESEVGGLSKTITFDGGRIDIGGHRFFSQKDEILNLWQCILPESEEGMLLRERVSHILWNAKLIAYPLQLDSQTLKELGFFNGIKVILSYLAGKCRHIKIKTLEDFYVNRFGKELYSMFFQYYTKKLWGLSANELSSDWGNQRIQKVSLQTLVLSAIGKLCDDERSLIKKYRYPALGAGQLWNKLSKCVQELGGIIELGSTVECLRLEGSNIKLLEYRKGNAHYQMPCDYIISSMPLRELIFSISESPIKIKEICNRLYFRDMLIVAFDLPQESMGSIFQKIKKDSWIYMRDVSTSIGRIQILNNWSPFATKEAGHILLELEYFCTEGDLFWNKEDAQILELSLKELIQCGICNHEASICHSVIKRVEKAYPVYADGYYELPAVEEWINEIDNLQCIGRNGQHRYNNMDHASETGLIAARNIINKTTDRKLIWNVNTDKNYIERR